MLENVQFRYGFERDLPMLRVTKLTDYATVLLTALAEAPGRVHSAAELAERVDQTMALVDMTEIEAALAKHPSVGEAVVAARGEDPDRALVAYAVPREGAGIEAPETLTFSEHLACSHCGISFDELAPRNFSFNSPYGACERCGTRTRRCVNGQWTDDAECMNMGMCAAGAAEMEMQACGNCGTQVSTCTASCRR